MDSRRRGRVTLARRVGAVFVAFVDLGLLFFVVLFFGIGMDARTHPDFYQENPARNALIASVVAAVLFSGGVWLLVRPMRRPRVQKDLGATPDS